MRDLHKKHSRAKANPVLVEFFDESCLCRMPSQRSRLLDECPARELEGRRWAK